MYIDEITIKTIISLIFMFMILLGIFNASIKYERKLISKKRKYIVQVMFLILYVAIMYLLMYS